jgi:preprotein translocase subunit SecA
MTGTAATEAGEFAHTYALEVVTVPTNRPMIRDDEADLIYKSEDGKFNAVADDIQERYRAGQPVLVGTISVEKSEKLSRLLEKRGVPHSVLNAKQHEREAGIVTQAGRIGAVTVATNMAGRGVDILLGGNPEGLAHEELLAEGSTPEEAPEKYDKLLEEFKLQCTEEGNKVRELGGLYVLGTERHESRRIDDQLRGRSGRQGDPGASRFYLSLEDDLMRLFATGAMSWVMGKTFPDDVPLEAKMVTRAIERAQRTVEDRNFEIRKDVLKYDEVMNEQRKVIYRRRQQILDGGDLREESLDAIEGAIDHIVKASCGDGDFSEDWDLDELMVAASDVFPTRVHRDQLAELGSSEAVFELLHGDAVEQYEKREEAIGTDTLREIERRVMLSVIDQHWREHLYEMDYLREGINLRAMGQRDPLAEWQREGFDMFEAMMEGIKDDFVRYIFRLEVVADDQPRQARNLRYSAAEDPVQGSGGFAAAALAGPIESLDDGGGMDGMGEMDGGPRALPPEQAPMEPVRVEKTPGRNEPCYCGSGKKYKLCHGR